MELNLKIDPEFQEKIPPLTETEYKQLEDNILEAGQVYEPIAVWNGTIVDGHNRYKIVLDHPNVKWSIREMHFADKWEAFDWMYKNQLGRRNLTVEQRKYLVGKEYEARMHVRGTNRYTLDKSAQSGHSTESKVREQIAKEQNMGKTSVERAKNYAKGIDVIKSKEPALADSILQSKTKVDQADIQAIGMAYPEEQDDMVESVKAGRKIISRRDFEKSKNDKAKIQEIACTAAKMFDSDTIGEYAIENLIKDIRINSSPFVSLIRQMILRNQIICSENKDAVIQAINENIIDQIKTIEEEIEKL